MSSAYQQGRSARLKGRSKDSCPYGHTTSREDDTPSRKQRAQRVMRAFWLGGWHDEDREMGFSVLEVER